MVVRDCSWRKPDLPTPATRRSQELPRRGDPTHPLRHATPYNRSVTRTGPKVPPSEAFGPYRHERVLRKGHWSSRGGGRGQPVADRAPSPSSHTLPRQPTPADRLVRSNSMSVLVGTVFVTVGAGTWPPTPTCLPPPDHMRAKPSLPESGETPSRAPTIPARTVAAGMEPWPVPQGMAAVSSARMRALAWRRR